jgi:aerobic-type carbon monoxide dehydrogenase small subunit (CoxS/CutS family)
MVEINVNGVVRRAHVDPRTSLADFLRHGLGLTGTHIGCEQGVCGACTVRLDGELVRSCLMFAVQANNACVETVEGLASAGDLHPIQRAFQLEHGLQCGFCTPGLLLSVQCLLELNANPSDQEIREYLSGNICRCTGYNGIVAAVRHAARLVSSNG